MTNKIVLLLMFSSSLTTINGMDHQQIHTLKEMYECLQKRTPQEILESLQDADTHLVEPLIEKGANIHKSSVEKNYTLLMDYALDGKENICEKLCQLGIDVNACNDEKRTALIMAIGRGHVGVCKVLLDHKADVNVIDMCGNTPLHEAIRLKDTVKSIDIVTLLLEAKALTTIKNKEYGYTALLCAASYNREDAARLLVNYGASVHDSDLKRMTPLHYAAYNGNKKLCELCITHGANINAQDTLGNTPLLTHLGGIEWDKELCTLFIKHGADLTIHNKEKRYAREILQRSKDFKLLLEHKTQ